MRLTLGDHAIDCTDGPAIMGILNVATDSRITHSVATPDAALGRARAMRDAGAAIIDVGAHSTKTGAQDVPFQEEIDRVCPVIAALSAEGGVVSVDTWSPAVARAAAEAGVHILNDVTAATDPAMAEVAREHRLPIIVMHMRGAPKRHRDADQRYRDVAAEVRDYLAERVVALTAAGVTDVWLDPGFQFGKSTADNVRLLTGLPAIVALGQPVVVSLSRKGFLAELLGGAYRQDAPFLLEASLAVNTLAAWSGAHVLRVHDVPEMDAAARVLRAIRAQLRADAPRP